MHLAGCRELLIPQEIEVASDQNVALHEDEAVWQQLPQLLHAQGMLHAAVIADLGHLPLFVWVFCKFSFKVNNLALGVVD